MSSAPQARLLHINKSAISSVGQPIVLPQTQPPLAIVVRADSKFATKKIVTSFCQTGREVFSPSFKEAYAKAIRNGYKAWETKVLMATLNHIDLEGVYGLSNEQRPTVETHIYSPNDLVRTTIKRAGAFLTKTYPEKGKGLFVSLDDMIHGGAFKASEVEGQFAEIGFSRIFSHTGTELCFVKRPGLVDLDAQIEKLRETVEAIHDGGRHRVPIILLEDNVRRAKTLLWIFEKMEQAGVLKHGKIIAVATCFSVAKEEEQQKIVCQGSVIPLIVGADYGQVRADVVTPRDHLFDGFVIQTADGFGRLPSFLLPPNSFTKQFKILPALAGQFRQKLLAANMSFCAKVRTDTGRELTLSDFPSGTGVAEVTGASIDTPMRDMLRHVATLNNWPTPAPGRI